jgi:hypothetical protein
LLKTADASNSNEPYKYIKPKAEIPMKSTTFKPFSDAKRQKTGVQQLQASTTHIESTWRCKTATNFS